MADGHSFEVLERELEELRPLKAEKIYLQMQLQECRESKLKFEEENLKKQKDYMSTIRRLENELMDLRTSKKQYTKHLTAEFEAEKAAFLANFEKKKKDARVDRVAAQVLQSKTDALEQRLSALETRVDAIAALCLAVTTLKIVENEGIQTCANGY